MHVILMGAQGAGKGTQAERLAPRFRLVHLSTGELFRAAVAGGTALGQLAKGYLDSGELVPDEVTIRIVDARLTDIVDGTHVADGVRGALFDGFPRTSTQAEGLDVALATRGERIAAVVEIDVPREQLARRLSGRLVCPVCGATYQIDFNPPVQEGVCDRCGSLLVQRADDTPEAIGRRLDIYFAQIEPLLAYYAERGLLTRVNGDQSIDKVTKALVSAIESAASP